jgi:hypothetical protein
VRGRVYGECCLKWLLLSVLCSLLSALCYVLFSLLSALQSPLSTFCSLLSDLWSLLSAFGVRVPAMSTIYPRSLGCGEGVRRA